MSRRLLIGSGGCGGKLDDTILTIMDESTGIVNEYDALFINANQIEMEKLSHYKLDKNSLLIDGQGTGKNRYIGKDLISDDSVKIYNRLEGKIKNYDCVTIFISSDGGFGSSSIVPLSKMIKTFKNSILIELAIASPSKKNGIPSLKNACEMYPELQLLMKASKDPDRYEEYMIFDEDDYAIEIPLVDSFIFLNNEEIEKQPIDEVIATSIEEQQELSPEDLKRCLDQETIFNFKAMDLYLKSIDLHSGAVDPVDVLEAHKKTGYKVILPLEAGYSSIIEAVEAAIEDSPFILPQEFERSDEDERIKCKGIVGYLDRNCYDKKSLSELFDCKGFVKVEYLEEYEKIEGIGGFIVLTGVKSPTEHIKALRQQLEALLKEEAETENNSEEEILSFDIDQSIDKKSNRKKRTQPTANTAPTRVNANTNNSNTEVKRNSALSALEKRKKIKNLKKF